MRFRESLAQLDSDGLLTRIEDRVSTKYQISALLKKYEGKPILFENVDGGPVPVAGNLLSSMDLLCKSLGIRKQEWIERLNLAMMNPGAITEGLGEFEYFEPDLDLVSGFAQDDRVHVHLGPHGGDRGFRLHLAEKAEGLIAARLDPDEVAAGNQSENQPSPWKLQHLTLEIHPLSR
jgi:hypothetical protein